MTDIPTSPRIRRLQNDILRGDAQAVEAFWAEIEASGTPLFERDETDPDAYVVTFLWRETEPTRNVILVEWFSNYDKSMKAKIMTNLPESNVWYKSLRVQGDLSTTYHFLLNETSFNDADDPNYIERFSRLQLDPLNPRTVHPREESGPDWQGGLNASVLAMPDAPRLPIDDLPATTEVTPLREETIFSAALDCEKTIWIHAPVRSQESDVQSHLLIQTDGEIVIKDKRMLAMLDEVQSDPGSTPLITVFVGNNDRNAELPCNPDFATFIADDLIPYVRENYSIAEGPSAVIMSGQSYGGLAAAWVSLTRPNAVGNAFCQSASFWWWQGFVTHNATEKPLGTRLEHAWLPAWVAKEPKKDVRFWLDAGILENVSNEFSPSLLSCNRHMRDVLIAKGYDLTYREFPGGHDFWNWRGIYLDGLRHFLNRPSPG